MSDSNPIHRNSTRRTIPLTMYRQHRTPPTPLRVQGLVLGLDLDLVLDRTPLLPTTVPITPHRNRRRTASSCPILQTR